MSSDPAIHAQQLGKAFQLYDRPIDRLKQIFARNARRYYREFTALRDVSFELQKGEVLGLVGRNGAGADPAPRTPRRFVRSGAGPAQLS